MFDSVPPAENCGEPRTVVAPGTRTPGGRLSAASKDGQTTKTTIMITAVSEKQRMATETDLDLTAHE